MKLWRTLSQNRQTAANRLVLGQTIGNSPASYVHCTGKTHKTKWPLDDLEGGKQIHTGAQRTA